jgi:hypothetical protein
MKVRWIACVADTYNKWYIGVRGWDNGNRYPQYHMRVRHNTSERTNERTSERAKLYLTKEEAEADAKRFAEVVGFSSLAPFVKARRVS